MIAKRRVFVDTGIFYAFIDKDDSRHDESVELFRRAESEGWVLITSNFVVAETHALLLSRLGRRLAARWLESVFDYFPQ